MARVGAWRAMLYANDLLLKRLEEEMLREHGLELSWYEVMLHLAEAGGQATQRALLERMLMGQSGLSRILTRMEAAQLVERVTVESDRRNLLVALTRLGRERLRRAAPTHIAGIKRWFGDRLTARQADAIKTGLEKVLRGLTSEDDTASESLAEVAIGQSILSLSSDAVSVADSLVVRDTLEPLVITDAARYATTQDVGELRELLGAMARQTDSPVAFLQADWQLHRRIAQITPNQVLEQVYTALLGTLEQHVESIVPSTQLPEYLQQRLRLHAALVDAIADHDAETAGDLARQHRLTPPGTADEQATPTRGRSAKRRKAAS
jgi:DNA-binding GntR family transcriptional regulator/DNA-binding MarR family transcriptional regulator